MYDSSSKFNNYYETRKEQARQFYYSQKEIYCPYFGVKIKLNSEGFHHLHFSSRYERSTHEKLLRFSLLPDAFEIIRSSKTVQEYRKRLVPTGIVGKRDGAQALEIVHYWGFVALIRKKLIRAVLLQKPDGEIIFWSVMRADKIDSSLSWNPEE